MISLSDVTTICNDIILKRFSESRETAGRGMVIRCFTHRVFLRLSGPDGGLCVSLASHFFNFISVVTDWEFRIDLFVPRNELFGLPSLR
jgi:hypothetical protein